MTRNVLHLIEDERETQAAARRNRPPRPACVDRYTAALEAEVERLRETVQLLQGALQLADTRVLEHRRFRNAPTDPAPGGSDNDERTDRR